jgi:hypothetical protein
MIPGDAKELAGGRDAVVVRRSLAPEEVEVLERADPDKPGAFIAGDATIAPP